MGIRRLALRLWIAGASVFSFLVGLAMLAHSPKPVQSSAGSTQYQSLVLGPLDTLEPLPPMDFSRYFQTGGVQVQQFNVQELPTPIPQQPSVVQQQASAVQQPATTTQKKGKGAKQQGGGGSPAPVVTTGGS